MKTKEIPAPERAGTVDVEEWAELGYRLALAGPEKFDELIGALRKIVDAQETIAEYDDQLFYRGRPRKRYMA